MSKMQALLLWTSGQQIRDRLPVLAKKICPGEYKVNHISRTPSLSFENPKYPLFIKLFLVFSFIITLFILVDSMNGCLKTIPSAVLHFSVLKYAWTLPASYQRIPANISLLMPRR